MSTPDVHVLIDEDTKSATRIDADTGVTERVEFFGSGTERIFGTRYLPGGTIKGGLVVCSSIHAEMLNAYRREVLLARAVAGRGVVVQRFHYRGQGHSDGESSEMTFERLVDDAVTAAARLSEETGVASPAFLGTRFGALVAAAAVSRYEGAPLVLWDPIMDGEQFFKDAFRATMMSAVKEQRGNAQSTANLLKDIEREGFTDVLGYAVHAQLLESTKGRSLAVELKGEPRPIFIGQIGRSSEPRPQYRHAIEDWTKLGFEVHLEILRQDEISWFLANERKLQESRQPLADASVDWLAESIAGATA